MAKTSSGQAVINVTGDGNFVTLNITLSTNVASPFNHQLITTSNGATTVTPPSTAIWMVIVPPILSMLTKTLKGVTGDTGVPLSVAQPSIISLAASPGTFVLTCNGIEVVEIYFL